MPIDVPTLAASCVSTAALGIVGIMLRRVEKGCITAEAYERITGEDYKEAA